MAGECLVEGDRVYYHGDLEQNQCSSRTYPLGTAVEDSSYLSPHAKTTVFQGEQRNHGFSDKLDTKEPRTPT